MPNWSPKPEWKDQDAILIGGGASLRKFDFSVLKGKNVIGCNDAFRLGKDIVSYCLFGDPSFFEKNREELATFGNPVVTCAPSILNKPIPWLLQMRRIRDGLHEGNIVGWNYSTGATATNLALSLGARRIMLLGYDLGLQPNGRSHWHDAHPVPPREEAYRRFMRGFHSVAASLKRYPEVQVFNVTDGSSNLKLFPTMSFLVFQSLMKERAA